MATPVQPKTALWGSDLTLTYDGTTVVHHADITLASGRVLALVGPNGSGKSTLLRALARLHGVQTGTVGLRPGEPADDLSAREFARRVTMLSQSRPSGNGLCVDDVVAFGRYPHRRRFAGLNTEDREAIAWAMSVTGVTDMARRPVDGISGGELQRVWLATCLAQRTDVLLLDEPTNHLDLRFQMEVLDLAHELAAEHGVAVGIVLHDLNQAAGVADEVVVLHEGRIQACGPPDEVLTCDLLTRVYGLPVDVCRDPATGVVQCQARGRHRARCVVNRPL